MKKRHIVAIMLVCVLFLGGTFDLRALAGTRTLVSQVSAGEVDLNNADWNFTDANIVVKDNKLIIPSGTSTSETKFISKNVATLYPEVDNMIKVDASLKLTNLPAGQQFIFVFGLAGIEASAGESGNVELVFTNNGGVKFGVSAYSDTGQTTLRKASSCGISMNNEFTISAVITTKGALLVSINGSALPTIQLPVSGEGRFGVLQTGSCGAEFTDLTLTSEQYERPENADIFEDFEKGEFNANLLTSSTIADPGIYPCQVLIEDYNGSKVLMFKNTYRSYFATKCEYSNFELSFDIPYWLGEDIYDEDDNIIAKKQDMIGIGWGENVIYRTGQEYLEDIDLVTLQKDRAVSYLRGKWDLSYDALGIEGIPDATSNEGYSVKFSVIDGYASLQIKPLGATTYSTVVEDYYDVHRSGYVCIWLPYEGYCAIDNFKIVNKDKNPNLVQVDYKSSIMSADDYVLTEEESNKTLKEDPKPIPKNTFNGIEFLMICGLVAVLFIGVSIVIKVLMAKKTRREQKHE